MRSYTGILTIALAVLNACAPSLAVVHGIQPSNQHYEPPPTGSRNGYRYNGPAHKYLPAASEPATEAVTTTGHWVPNPVQSPEQMVAYEHTFSSKPLPEPDYQHELHELHELQQLQQQQGYLGPYNMQYYEREQQLQQQQHQQQLPVDSRQQPNRLNTFQFAANHQGAAGGAAGGQRGEAYGLSAGAEHDRHVELDRRGAQLIGQALPERYQRQPFAGHQMDDSPNFVQMQSNSFELPPIYVMQMEWPQHAATPAPAPAPAPEFRPQQSYKREPEYDYPAHGQGHTYGQYAQSHNQQTQQSEYMQPSTLHVHAHTPTAQTAYFAPPSREFQAPYY